MRVKIVRTPEEHATGDKSPTCTCRGLEGEVLRAFDNGVVDVRLDKGGRVGVPFKYCRELPA